ncbi:outer membrane beta-barrel protein [Sphingobacteriaceae bacterium WQ 2009]|uniref:Outer membrane beta-barrel protein n=1 Tax=Rhinopithecimicrobium faecis TaxID=2820698 RepID=A0A8T4HCK2_9SPHI|nr:outer membrane beta-barrel protein [Sphingobacteriaceae bacterium WQ 2009]
MTRLLSFLIPGIYLFITFQSVHAQQQYLVKGSIVDSLQNPISGATISLLDDLSESPLQIVSSNENGHFSFTAIEPGSYNIAMRHLYYEPYQEQIVVSSDSSYTYQLIPSSYMLDDVVINAPARRMLQYDADRITMNLENSIQSAGHNAYEIVSMAPLVRVRGDDIQITGNTNALIFLNGRRLPPSSLKSILENIPGEQLLKIEIISQPSSKYDAEASGGVIEIFTKKPKSLGWSGNINSNIAQGITFSSAGNGNLNYTSEKIYLTINAGIQTRGHIENGYLNRTIYNADGLNEGMIQFDKDLQGRIHDTNISANLQYDVNKKSYIGFNFSHYHTNINTGGDFLSTITQLANADQATIATEFGLLYKLQTIQGDYVLKLDSVGSEIKLASNYTIFKNTQNQMQRDINETSRNNLWNDLSATYHIWAHSFDLTKIFNHLHSIDFGLKHTNTNNESRETTLYAYNPDFNTEIRPTYSEAIQAGYLTYKRTLKEKLTIQVGIRLENTQFKVLDQQDSSYLSLFPEARINLKINDLYSTSLSYVRNIDRPNYELLVPYTRFLDAYNVQVGNPNLLPEYTHALSWTNIFKSYSLSLAYQYVENAISSTIFYDIDQTFYTNTVVNFKNRRQLSVTGIVPLKFRRLTSDNSVSLHYQNNLIPITNTDIERKKLYVHLQSINVVTLGKNWDAELQAFYTSKKLNGIYTEGDISSVSLGFRKSLWNKSGYVKIDASDIFYTRILRWSTDIIPVTMHALSRNDTRQFRITFSYNLGKLLKSKKPDAATQDYKRLGL